MPQNQVQPTIFCPVPNQENSHCYIIVCFCVYYILMLRVCCVVVLLLYLLRFPQFEFVSWICFFSQSIYEFRTVVYYCCLYKLNMNKHNA